MAATTTRTICLSSVGTACMCNRNMCMPHLSDNYQFKQVRPSATLALLCTEPRHKWQGSVFVHTLFTIHYTVRAGGAFVPLICKM